jgi:hypothetical protein
MVPKFYNPYYLLIKGILINVGYLYHLSQKPRHLHPPEPQPSNSLKFLLVHHGSNQQLKVNL